ncbi:hypothetical protein [Paenarthrobacter sp.]|nr:hypothetical protein [Paenarthrobacter sp.]
MPHPKSPTSDTTPMPLNMTGRKPEITTLVEIEAVAAVMDAV